MCVGVGLGFGVSFWGMRMVRRAASRYSPQRLVSDVRVMVKGPAGDGT